MKKTVGILLALLLLFSLSIPAFATEPTGPKPVVTKNPTGETVDEGGTATFIAHAENYNEIIWRIVSNDTTNTIQASDAPGYFGCEVYGIGTETLIITKIPAEMDGWRVEAMFRGPGGVEFSWGALIRVNGVTIKAPTISAQPQGLSLSSGETGTLSVSAAAVDGTLQYQWYSNTANSNEGGTAIDGAKEASYTPAELTGTTYYYVAVSSVVSGRASVPTLSNAVAVTYTAPASEETEPARESAAPGTQAPLVPVVDTPEHSEEPTEAPADTADQTSSADAAQQRAGNALNMLTIVGGVLAVAAIVGGVTAIVVRRRGDDEDDEDEE